ncbi:MAG: ribonuclease HII, partial [Candidatus Thermoplasmatota archaeon]|nr:ribonuclease HII [Candidatus Thermoplasmatota archaeon]
AGRGPAIGPLLVGAVAVDNDDFLKKIEVKDSKRYSNSSREAVFRQLKDKVCFSVEMITAENIDIKRKSLTLNRIEVNAFAAVLHRLFKKLSYRFDDLSHMISNSMIYVDSCDVNEERFARDLAGELAGYCGKSGTQANMDNNIFSHIVSKHKADVKFPVVSAASVVAKTFREREIEKIKHKLGEDFGSGYPSDQRSRQYLEDYFRKNRTFPQYVRHSWDTLNKIKKKVCTTSLEDFL